jgi:protein transport protein SEC61 subunit gamma and related proteins
MGIGQKMSSFVLQSNRVWKLLKRPSRLEFTTIAKVSALGILVIGAIGFLIGDTMKFLARAFG